MPEEEIVAPLKPVIRIATEDDKKHADDNKKKEEEAFNIYLKKIKDHNLEMKLIDVEYTLITTRFCSISLLMEEWILENW